MGETSWGSWTLRRADADLVTVVAEATAVLPQQVREPLAEVALDYYRSLDAALAYDAPGLLADHLVRSRRQLSGLRAEVDRATLLRSLGEVLGRHVDAEARMQVDHLVAQTVLIAGQRTAPAEERLAPDVDDLVARLLALVDAGDPDLARGAVVAALEDGCAPRVLLEQVLVPFHDALVARAETSPPPRTDAERQQQLVRTLLFSLVPPDLGFPVADRRVLLTEARLPAGWRAGLARTMFEVAGWRVDTVEADAPAETLAKAALTLESQVVLVQAAGAADLDEARARIDAVRGKAPESRVLALGGPFAVVPQLAQRLGAHAGCGGLAGAPAAAVGLLRG